MGITEITKNANLLIEGVSNDDKSLVEKINMCIKSEIKKIFELNQNSADLVDNL